MGIFLSFKSPLITCDFTSTVVQMYIEYQQAYEKMMLAVEGVVGEWATDL